LHVRITGRGDGVVLSARAIALIHLASNSLSHADVDAAVSAVVKLYASEASRLQAEEVDLLDYTVHQDFVHQGVMAVRREQLYAILQAADCVTGDLNAAILVKRISLEKSSGDWIRDGGSTESHPAGSVNVTASAS
jgi:hypothetical protein